MGKTPLVETASTTLGGPIIKDKLFFFTDYEAVRQRNGVSFTAYVPTAAFDASLPPLLQPVVAQLPPPNGPVSAAEPRLALYCNSYANVDTEDTGMMKIDYLPIKGKHQMKIGAQIARMQCNKEVNFQQYAWFPTLDWFAADIPFLDITVGWPRPGLRITPGVMERGLWKQLPSHSCGRLQFSVHCPASLSGSRGPEHLSQGYLAALHAAVAQADRGRRCLWKEYGRTPAVRSIVSERSPWNEHRTASRNSNE